MATLVSIALRVKSRAAMTEVPSRLVTTAAGVQGDARGGPGARQVTVLSQHAWRDACVELAVDLPWTFRRANLLVDEIRLFESAGKRLRVGDVLLEITGETEPCGLMEAQHAGLLAALRPEWRGGVCCRVLDDGLISVGDPVRLEDPAV